MNFDRSSRAAEWLGRLEAFLERYLLPFTAAWHSAAARGTPPEFVAELRTLAR